MNKMRIAIFVAAAALLVGTISSAQAQSYEARAEVKDLMHNFVGPTGGRLNEMSRAGGPQSDEEWDDSASAGRALADISQLLLMAGRVKDRVWADGAQKLAPAAEALANASTAKNMDQWKTAQQQVGQACMTCHEVHRPRPQRGGGAGARGGGPRGGGQ